MLVDNQKPVVHVENLEPVIKLNLDHGVQSSSTSFFNSDSDFDIMPARIDYSDDNSAVEDPILLPLMVMIIDVNRFEK